MTNIVRCHEEHGVHPCDLADLAREIERLGGTLSRRPDEDRQRDLAPVTPGGLPLSWGNAWEFTFGDVEAQLVIVPGYGDGGMLWAIKTPTELHITTASVSGYRLPVLTPVNWRVATADELEKPYVPPTCTIRRSTRDEFGDAMLKIEYSTAVSSHYLSPDEARNMARILVELADAVDRS